VSKDNLLVIRSKVRSLATGWGFRANIDFLAALSKHVLVLVEYATIKAESRSSKQLSPADLPDIEALLFGGSKDEALLFGGSKDEE
jgi:hypothetical protein